MPRSKLKFMYDRGEAAGAEMKAQLSLAVGVALLLSAEPFASADFRLAGYAYPGPDNDVYEIYALNDGLHGTGTLILSDDVTLFDRISIFGGSGFVFKYEDNSLFAPADLTGVTLYNSSGHNPAVLFGGHQDRTFINLLGDESTANPTAYAVASTHPENDGLNYFFPQNTWEQVGMVPGGVDASPAVNGGRGALVGVGVVSHGETVMAEAQVNGVGGTGAFLVWPAPEPASAALVALGVSLAVLYRRRT